MNGETEKTHFFRAASALSATALLLFALDSCGEAFDINERESDFSPTYTNESEFTSEAEELLPIYEETSEETSEASEEASEETSETSEEMPEIPDKPAEGRGFREDIPEEIKEQMAGCSLPKGASVTFDELAYLTIPHYDFDYNIVCGHLVVNKAVADELLDIFAELFDLKYPIERMELIDVYEASDFLSIENNNTSAFNYRVVTSGSGKLSMHSFGLAIDINPQINPYVRADGTGAHQNASEYWSRDVSEWKDPTAVAAYIGEDTEIYRIFTEKGWEWGGSWTSYRDYQHFEKHID